MKIIEKTLYCAYIVWWIIAPVILENVMEARNVSLPKDLWMGIVGVWYATGIVQLLWSIRNTKRPPSNGSRNSVWRERDNF